MACFGNEKSLSDFLARQGANTTFRAYKLIKPDNSSLFVNTTFKYAPGLNVAQGVPTNRSYNKDKPRGIHVYLKYSEPNIFYKQVSVICSVADLIAIDFPNSAVFDEAVLTQINIDPFEWDKAQEVYDAYSKAYYFNRG